LEQRKNNPASSKIFLIEKDQQCLSQNLLEQRKKEPVYSKIFKSEKVEKVHP